MRAYREILSLPGALRFSAAAFVGRLPMSMLGLGSVLLVQQRTGSYAAAGVVSAGFFLGGGVGNPWISRQVDRRGQAAVLTPSVAVHTVALLSLVALAVRPAPTALLLLPAAVMGAAFPVLTSCVRTRWAALLRSTGRPDALATAFAFESVVEEVIYVVGPLLVVTLGTTTDPAVALLLCVALTVGGTVSFARARDTEPAPQTGAHGGRSALRTRGMPVVTGVAAAIGGAFGFLEVGMVGFADEHGRQSVAGILLALVAVGSGTSGLAYGMRRWTSPPSRRLVVAAAAFAAACVSLPLAGSVPLMAAAALLAGLCIAPTLIAAFGAAEELLPTAVQTEGLAWMTSAITAGLALGAAVAGRLVDSSGARTALAGMAVAAALAAAVAAAGRRTLVRPSDPTRRADAGETATPART